MDQVLRVLASESRFARRYCSELLMGARKVARGRGRNARFVNSLDSPDVTYVFLFVPRRPGEGLEEYREHRRAVLLAYCRVGRLKEPDKSIFIGIGLDHPDKDYPGESEDIVYWEQPTLTSDDISEMEQIRRDCNLLGPTMTYHRYIVDEFPVTKISTPTRIPRTKGPTKKKALAKIRKASQRRNRR